MNREQGVELERIRGMSDAVAKVEEAHTGHRHGDGGTQRRDPDGWRTQRPNHVLARGRDRVTDRRRRTGDACRVRHLEDDRLARIVRVGQHKMQVAVGLKPPLDDVPRHAELGLLDRIGTAVLWPDPGSGKCSQRRDHRALRDPTDRWGVRIAQRLDRPAQDATTSIAVRAEAILDHGLARHPTAVSRSVDGDDVEHAFALRHDLVPQQMGVSVEHTFERAQPQRARAQVDASDRRQSPLRERAARYHAEAQRRDNQGDAKVHVPSPIAAVQAGPLERVR